MNALHYILLGVITALIIHLISSARRRKREREALEERQRVSDWAKRWKESEFTKRVSPPRPIPPIPPPDRKRYTYKATTPPPPDNSYMDDALPYLAYTNSPDTNHSSTPDYGGGGDFGGGGSTDSWGGSSDSGSSSDSSSYDSGSSSSND